MDITNFSEAYSVRKLTAEDADVILAVCEKNEIFYLYHPSLLTEESILEDIEALPPGKTYEDKYYIGFFQKEQLIAVMDLILGYPAEEIAFIGFFMMNTAFQGYGVGTKIITSCLAHLKECGYRRVQLGIDKGNPQSEAFWLKNGFGKTGREVNGDVSVYVYMERIL